MHIPWRCKNSTRAKKHGFKEPQTFVDLEAMRNYNENSNLNLDIVDANPQGLHYGNA